MEVISPTGRLAAPIERANEKSHDEPSKTVLGVLVNGKEYSDVVLDRLTDLLRDRAPYRRVVRWNKGFPAKESPFRSEMVDTCDVVLTGVGH